MSINERIQCIVDELFSGNKARFAKAINKTPNTVSNILGARRSLPSSDILEAIANSIESIDLRWLLTGCGEMKAEKIERYYSSSLHLNHGADANAPIVAEPPVPYSEDDPKTDKDFLISVLLKDVQRLSSDKEDLRRDKQRLLDEIDDLKAQLGRQSSRVGKAG